MKSKSKRFLILLTAASLSLNLFSVRAIAVEDAPEVSYDPIIIDIPDGPIPAGENWDDDVSTVDIIEEDIPTTDSFKENTSGNSSKLWITVGGVSGAGVLFTAICQKIGKTK